MKTRHETIITRLGYHFTTAHTYILNARTLFKACIKPLSLIVY